MRQAIAGGTRNAKAGLRQLLVLAALAPLLMIIQPSGADAQRCEPPRQKPQVTMNAWTVGAGDISSRARRSAWRRR